MKARISRACVQALEARRLLCGIPHTELAPVPQWSDAIEQQYASAAPEGGPEAVSIVWANRGQASDGFAAAFGTSANAGRAVVDAVFAQWGRIIQSFNRSDGTSTLQVNLNISGSAGFGATGAPEGTPQADRKPRTGSITINAGNIVPNTPNDSNGWFFDPTPNDNAEFLGNVNNAYNATATNTGQGADFFSVVALEMAHVLGMISDRDDAGGAWGLYTLEDRTFTTGTRDNGEGGGNFGFFYIFDGPNIDHLMTGYNSGDATSNSWGNVIHTSGGGNMTFGGNVYRGADDDSNALYNGTERVLPSFVVSRILGDAYNYTINDPEQFATMHAVLNQSNGQLTIRGSSSPTSNDFLALESSGSDFLVIVDIGEDVPGTGPLPGAGNIDGYFTRIPKASVNSIVMDGGGGNDIIRIENNDFNPTTIRGGGGDDFIDFSFALRNLSNITASTFVEGGGGFDTIFVYDTAVSAAQTFTLNSVRFDRPGWGGFSYASDTENHVLTTGTGADVVNIESTFTAQPIVVNSAGGGDTVNIGRSTDGIRGILADVQVQNDPSFTTLNINNGPDATGRTFEVGISGSFGFLTGMAPANIFWDNADIATINLTAGSGVDTGRFSRSSETFNLNTTGGADVITVGSPSASGMQGITGQLTIDNTPSFTALTLDDTGSGIARNITLDELGGYNTVTGMAPALIRFDSVDVSSATIITGFGFADNVFVPRTDEALNISNSGGFDQVHLGNTTDGVQSILGAVTITNPPSFTTVNINNGPDTVGRTASLSNIDIGGSTFGEWSGLAPAPIRYKYADISAANVTLGSVNDLILVRQSQKNLNITTTGGQDSVVIGGTANGAQSVFGEINIQNPPSFTTVTVDDANNTTGVTATVDDVTISGSPFGRISGLAPGNIAYKYNDTSAVTLIHGSGNDNLTVLRHQENTTIQGSAGNDTVTLGGGQAGMNGVFNTYLIANATGATSLVLNDFNDTTVNNIQHTLTAATNARVTGMGPATVNYRPGEVATARIRTSQNGNSVTITETSPGTAVYYDPGSIGDAVAVNTDDTGFAALHTDRNVNPNAVTIGENGRFVQTAGNFTFRTNQLLIDPTGQFDIGDGSLIHDYSAPSVLALVQSYITSGYAGGAWNGFGINSSAAAATVGTAVGYGEAAQVFSTFPATFAGQSVDNTTVLATYTRAGDANLDRVVDIGDFAILAARFNQPGAFVNGNFNYDATVNIGDFAILASNFNTSLFAARRIAPDAGAPWDERAGDDDRADAV